MNDRRSVVVGLFVLVGLILLGMLIVWFEGVAVLVRGGYIVRGHLPSAVGIRSGKRVHLDGIEVGDVRDVTTSQPQEAGVWIHMRINPDVRIPVEAEFVAQQTTVGDVYLDFRTTGTSADHLPTDGTAEVRGTIRTPSLLPEELVTDWRDAMRKFEKLDQILANLKELTEPRTLADLQQNRDLKRNLWTTLEQFQETAATLQAQLKGEDAKHGVGLLLAQATAAAKDLRETLAGAGKTLENADKTFAALQETGKTFQDAGKKADAVLVKTDALIAKLGKDTDAARALVDNLGALVTDLRAGKGTAGKLLTDDELHRALVTLIENLQTLSDNANRLITLWREESIFVKEGK